MLDGFVEHHGPALVEGTKKRFDDPFHYDLCQAATELLGAYLDEHTRPEHVERWLDLILVLRSRVGLPPIQESAAEVIAAAPAAVEAKDQTGDLVYVTSDHLAFTQYQQTGVLLLAPDVPLPEGTTHVAFYADGEIKTPIPQIRNDYPNLVIDFGTVTQLLQTNTVADQQAAQAIVGRPLDEPAEHSPRTGGR